MTSEFQRIRDPLHDIIAFEDEDFEHMMWNVIQTRPFQRLRRIKQLGFSELTFPGATHTRFSHSVGVFHTARTLMKQIEDRLGRPQFKQSKARQALAASLLHDVGHGMFSHSFEEVGKKLKLDGAKHENVSKRLITEGEVADVLEAEGGGFAADVATIIGRDGPSSIYDAVVSSQFDADRLDYMRRDRQMAGVLSGAIDFPWLVRNLEIGGIQTGQDDEPGTKVQTFVVGSKAIFAAEQYVLALFQLYPTIYFHKATRAAEKVFTALMTLTLEFAMNGDYKQTGLDSSHPICAFAQAPDDLERIIALDDTVLWGSLSMMRNAENKQIANLAQSLQDRRLPKSVDLEQIVQDQLGKGRAANKSSLEESAQDGEREKIITRARANIVSDLSAWSEDNSSILPRVLIDQAKRDPYAKSETKGPLNRIHVKLSNGEIEDISDHSDMVKALKPYPVFRAYVFEDDEEDRKRVEEIAISAVRKASHAQS